MRDQSGDMLPPRSRLSISARVRERNPSPPTAKPLPPSPLTEAMLLARSECIAAQRTLLITSEFVGGISDRSLGEFESRATGLSFVILARALPQIKKAALESDRRLILTLKPNRCYSYFTCQCWTELDCTNQAVRGCKNSKNRKERR